MRDAEAERRSPRPLAFRLGDGHDDEPTVRLGRDRGANPVEHVLHALAGRPAASLVHHAAARGMWIDAVESRLGGEPLATAGRSARSMSRCVTSQIHRPG